MNSNNHEALNILVDLHGNFVKAAKPVLRGAYTSFGSYDMELAMTPVMDFQRALNLVSVGRTGEASEIIEEYAEEYEKKALQNAGLKAGFLSGVSKEMVKNAKALAKEQEHMAGQLRHVLTLIR